MASLNCATCNKLSPSLRLHKKCSGCQSSSYCSKACQKEDWRTHQLVCAQFKSFLTSNPRPSSAHKLALLLPVNQKQPQFVWLHCIMRFEGYEYPQDREFLGADNPFHKRIPVSANMASSNSTMQRFALDHTIILTIREAGGVDGSPRNQCVAAMMKGTHRYDWRGPLIVSSQPSTRTNPLFYQDVVPADLRTIVDYFRCYGEGLDKDPGAFTIGAASLKDIFPSLSRKPNTVRGVDIAGKGDQHFLGQVKFSENEVTTDHAIFKDAKPTPISVHMKLPLLVRKYGNFYSAWVEPGYAEGFNPFENRTALFLNIETNEPGGRWGFTDLLEWDQNIGTVLVVREDKKDITAQQVEALCYFCQHELCPKMGLLMEQVYDWGYEVGGFEKVAKAKEEFVRKNMCREKFELFFEKFKQEKLAAGDGASEHAVSPYKEVPNMAELLRGRFAR